MEYTYVKGLQPVEFIGEMTSGKIPITERKLQQVIDSMEKGDTRIDTKFDDGRLRLIIASDEIRPEVRRMIEYLNIEMHRVDVLGLEMKCFGDGDTSMVTRSNGELARLDRLINV